MRGTWPFAGRSAQVLRLRDVLARPVPEALVVAGAAGVGKSRLVGEALAGLDERRIAVLSAVATTATSPLPYGAFAHLLSAPTGLVDEKRIGLAAITDRLLARAGARRVVVAVDDAHLLDTHSAALIHRLVRTKTAGAVITLRSGEPAPAPVVSLWTEALAERIELGPLSPTEINDVLERALDGPVDPGTSRRLARLSAGNVLLLRELVLAGDESGTLTCGNGIWKLDGPLPVNARLRELIDARLGHLQPSELDVLELVALAEPISLPVVCRLAGEDAVESVEAKHLVRVETDRDVLRVRMSHPLYSEVIRARCPAMRIRRQLRRLAEALEQTGTRQSDDILRIATWRLESGAGAEPELLTTATQLAWNVFDVDLGTRLGKAAVQAGAGVAAIVAFGKALFYADRREEAEHILAVGADRTTSNDDRAAVAIVMAFALCLAEGRRMEAHRVLDQAEGGVSAAETQRQIWATRTFLHYYAAEFDAALKHADWILESEATGGPGAEAGSLKALVLTHRGRTVQALALAGTTLSTATHWRSASVISELRLHQARGIAQIVNGHPAAAIRIIEEVYAEIGDTSWHMGIGLTELYRAFALRLQGKIDQAARWAAQAAKRCPLGRTVFGAVFRGEWAHCAALGGDVDAATRMLAQCRRHRTGAARIMEFFIDLAVPAVLGAAGRPEDAVQAAMEAAEQARQCTVYAFELLALHQAVGFGGAALVTDRLGWLATELDGDLAPVCAAQAQAAATNSPNGLRAASVAFDALGLTLFAAEAAAQASLAYQAAGKGEQARAANTRAWALAEQCPGARTAALATITSPGLTGREREIAGLAATGLTSRQIAERLTTSVRTVDNHLRSVYTKLGVSGRAELATSLALPTEPEPH